MSMDLQANPVNEILFVSFNQDSSCFACGTETGFRVYSTDPFRLTWSRDFSPHGGLACVAMLFRTNILALVGGGRSPKYQPHKVVLWDDIHARTIAELSFKCAVRSVRLRRELVVVAVSNKIYVYGFRSLALLDSIETTNNPKGLCSLSSGPERTVLACPGMQQGRVLVVFFQQDGGSTAAGTDPAEASAAAAKMRRERTTVVAAHDSPVAALATDAAGTLLATASDKGTIVRVFDAATGSRLYELRRGADRAEIHSLAFSPGAAFLAASSDKGTIHVFSLGQQAMPATNSGGYHCGGHGGSGGGQNAKSSLKRMARVLPAYFSSEWSFAQLRVPDCRCIASFGTDPHTVFAVCANGTYYRARFDPRRGGEMTCEEVCQFDEGSACAVDRAGVPPSSSGAPVTAAPSLLPATAPSSRVRQSPGPEFGGSAISLSADTPIAEPAEASQASEARGSSEESETLK